MIRLLPVVFIFSLILNAPGSLAQTTFLIESLPDATPTADTIFICGTFNNWVPNDERYALERQLNGQLAVTIPVSGDTLEYKFTRGSWTKVETDAANHYTANRKLFAGQSGKVSVTIDNWLDLGGARKLSFATFYFFACAFHGIALCLLLLRIPKKDDAKVVALLVINGAVVAMHILLVLNETTSSWPRYVDFIFPVSLFAWGPLIFYFVRVFLQRTVTGLQYYFIPLGVVTAAEVSQIMNLDMLSGLSGRLSAALTWGDLLFTVGATVFNAFVCMKIFHEYPSLKNVSALVESHRSRFVFYFTWTAIAGNVFIPANLLLLLTGYHHYFIEHHYAVAIVFSFLIFIEAYYLWRYPDIVRGEKPAHSPLAKTQVWVQKLDDTMRDSKVFRKPDLSTYELAEMLGMKPHTLSKLINETYQKNFRDFVNAYRIEEFISLAAQKQFKHYTFFALAQEAGFNSKSTFNLAFKKYTNQSPREYFRDKAVSECQNV